MPALLRDGLLRGAPAAWATRAPDFLAADPAEHAARGYLHGNCAHCHFDGGVPVPLRLALDAGQPPAAVDAAKVLRRAGTRNPYQQMPPLGTREIDRLGRSSQPRQTRVLRATDVGQACLVDVQVKTGERSEAGLFLLAYTREGGIVAVR